MSSLADVELMLLGEVKEPFKDPAWTYELKVDGFRILADVEHFSVRLETKQPSPFGRSGHPAPRPESGHKVRRGR